MVTLIKMIKEDFWGISYGKLWLFFSTMEISYCDGLIKW